jgi:hypothetical protein
VRVELIDAGEVHIEAVERAILGGERNELRRGLFLQDRMRRDLDAERITELVITLCHQSRIGPDNLCLVTRGGRAVALGTALTIGAVM